MTDNFKNVAETSPKTAQKKAELFASDLDYLQNELEWIEVRCWRITAQNTLNRLAYSDPDHTEQSYRFLQTTKNFEERHARNKRVRHRQSIEREDNSSEIHELKARVKRLLAREKKLRTTLDKRLKAHHKTVGPTSLDTLCHTFLLDAFERNVLLMTAAVAFSRRFEEYFRSINSTQFGTATSVESTFDFCELPFSERIHYRTRFSKNGALISNDLITIDLGYRSNSPEDVLTAQLHVTNQTFAFLVGQPSLMNEFIEFSSVEEPIASLDQVVLDPRDKQTILSVVERHDQYLHYRKEWGFDDIITYGRGALMLFYGSPGTGKTMMAHAVANAMNKRVLNVDIPTFVNHSEAQRFLPGLFREARLQNAVLFFDECEVLFSDRRSGNTLMTILLTEIERFEGIAILATNLPEVLDQALDRRILVKVRFPEPDREARLKIWQKHLPAAAPLTPDVDLEKLANRFELTGGYIKNVMLMAVAAAIHQNADSPRISMEILETAAQKQLQRPNSDQYSNVIFPEVRLHHIALNPTLRDQVEELIDAARDRRLILEKWGIGQHMSYGKGTSALFFGPPGTGKTLCAEAIAGELNRPLLTASMPAIQSKYVGQAERNLENLFDEARREAAVLFIDEADSLLMERGTGRASRHDDAIVNTLLTLIERHDGLVLLATNRATHNTTALDSALQRRLTYNLEFPMPTAPLRSEIWQKLLPQTVPTDGSLDFDRLGQRFALSGGLIKNAVFKAAFRAARHKQPITQALLETCAREELSTDTKASIGFTN